MSKHAVDPGIGKRTARAIREKCWEQNCTYTEEMERLRIESTSLMRYERGQTTSGAGLLQRMCLAGYDVVYILTGKRRQT